MAYQPQQQREHYDEYQQQPSRQHQYYNQGTPQQGRQPAGYNPQYDQQYDDYGYDQHGQYEQWDDGHYDQGGGWDHRQQPGYGNMSEQPRQQQQPRRAPSNGSQEYGYDQQYRQQQRDPRGVPAGRDAGGPPQGGMRPPPRERPRMAPASPLGITQDNPFPTFPSQKAKPRTNTGSMDEAMALMNLGTDNAGQNQGRGMGPPPGRGRGFPPAMQQRRPPMGRGGHSDMQRHDSGHYEGSRQGQRPPQDRMPPNRGPPPPQQGFGPPQRSVTMPQNMLGPGGQRNYDDSQQQWVEPGPVAGYHGPESPTYIPPRPTTAGGTKSQSYGPPQGHDQRPPMPRGPQQQRNQYQQQPMQPHEGAQAALDNVYDDYYGQDRQSKASSIDMPDFDAIQEPTTGRRRGDSLENHLSPTTTGPPADNMTRTAGTAYTRANNFYQQAAKSRSQPDLHGQYNKHEMEGHAPAVPAIPPTHTGYPPSNALPNGPRGRGPPPRGMTMDNASQSYGQGGQAPSFDLGYGRPPPGLQRVYSDETTYSEPPPSAMRNASPMAPGNPIQRPGTAAPAPGRVPSDPLGRRPGTSQPMNPDALPAHPAPFRPGLMQQQQNPHAPPPQAAKPPPVRQYNTDPTPNGYSSRPDDPAQQQRPASVHHPVTHDELNRLKNAWGGNMRDPSTGLKLAKKLVEAASVLADEGGTADTRTRNKNREKFIMEAHKIVKKLVAAGSPDAMFYLADCYGQGQLGLQVDTKEAFTLYQSAAKAGHPAAAYRTAVCCEMGHEEGGGTKKDPLKAVQWYRRAAALGDTPAMYKMGMILLKGLLGQQRHLGEAVNMLKRAADHADAENPHALHELGLLYEAQTGSERIMRDEPYAFSLFKQAAELGYKFSQFRLGQAFEYGLLGCSVDARLSIGWYTKAAAQEEHQSELALSGWYLTGVEGILNQSDTEAYLWARKAACAEPPLPKALFAMGYFTEVGIGCPRSLDEAKRWYGRAAAYKFPKAQERLEELKKGGSKVQMKRERLSRTNQKQQEENCVVM
ncbi:hypothetical protein BU23DRAFT_450894 [Bimuria novae-zelandiae CBS 107.79]|uniref:HCP-like protein n=1 Tax=Bimuria novae-zelandiae CBS 107.79 TaxID=1447943 RepID=A0A6A5VLI0_9PLEO|nr:hypothetical protein BU23DRAFT_450894 [Bimuria novae-zelandiae CBS 107.79]